MIGLIFMGLGCLVVLFGFGVAAYVLYANKTEQTKWENQPTATGTVVELSKRVSAARPGSGIMYHPVVEFQAPSGETIRFESSFGSMPAGQRVGQSVQVHYNPDHPQEAEIESPVTRWLGLGIAGFMGLIGACLGFGFIAVGFISFTVGF
jgi:hypothetical protein